METNTTTKGKSMNTQAILKDMKLAILKEKTDQLIEQVNARSISIGEAEAMAKELQAALQAI